MRMAAAPRILLAAGFWTLALCGLVANEGLARRGGQEVLLPMEAVDPRSILSGHYVALSLTRRLDQSETCPPDGDWKWVALRRSGDIYIAAGGATSRDEAQQIGLPVRGTFTCSQPSAQNGDVPAQAGWLSLNVGVERFHINQTDAERIERVLRAQSVNEQTRAFAIVSIGQDGHARLKGVMIDGQRLELNWL